MTHLKRALSRLLPFWDPPVDPPRNKWGAELPEIEAGRVFDERERTSLQARIDRNLREGHDLSW